MVINGEEASSASRTPQNVGSNTTVPSSSSVFSTPTKSPSGSQLSTSSSSSATAASPAPAKKKQPPPPETKTSHHIPTVVYDFEVKLKFTKP